MAAEQEQRGSKRIREEFVQQMHETSEGIERLFKMLKTGEVQELEQSQTMEETQQFVESLIQTPSSQREQKEGEGGDEVMQEAPAGRAVEMEQTHTSEEADREPVKEAKEGEKEPAQQPADRQTTEKEVEKKADEEATEQPPMEPVSQTAEQSAPKEKEEELKAKKDSQGEKEGTELPKEAEGQKKTSEEEGKEKVQAEEVNKESEKESEKEKEPEHLVLRRKAKSIEEAKVVESPPIILLTKKAVQEEEPKLRVIDIEDDEETEREEKKKEKGKEKAPEEGQEMVQRQASTSSLALGNSQAREMEEEESKEDEDEVRQYLNDMLKAMEKVDRANTEKNEKFSALMQVSLDQQQINIKQLRYIEDLLTKAALQESLHEAESRRSSEPSERLNLDQQRYIKTEQELKESKDELAMQKLQNEQMKIALQVANKRRIAAEEELDRLLTNPILSIAKSSTSDDALQKEHYALTELLKEKERQLGLMTQMFFQKEQELQNQIKGL